MTSVYMDEGRAYKNDEGEWRMEYVIRDHLGNTRVTFSDLNKDKKISKREEDGEVLQEHHLYPFGMNWDNSTNAPWRRHPKVDDNKDINYQYNGKELQDDLIMVMEDGEEIYFGYYDYGARFYDPSIGRFTGVDPIADEFPHVSVYNFAENEPIANIDLWGLQKVSINPIGSLKSKAESLVKSTGVNVNVGTSTRDLKIYKPLQQRNLFKDVGNGLKTIGSGVEAVGLGLSLFNPPAGGLVAGLGASMQFSGTGMVALGEIAESGEISNQTIIDGGVDAVFAVLPAGIKMGLDRLELDKGTKALAEAVAKSEASNKPLDFVNTSDYIMSIVNIGLGVTKHVVKDNINNTEDPPSFNPPDDVVGN